MIPVCSFSLTDLPFLSLIASNPAIDPSIKKLPCLYHSSLLRHYLTMLGFKAINSSSQAVAELIAAAVKKLKAEKSAKMSGPRERAASTVSAVTLSPEGGSDNEDAPQVPEKTKRKSPSKAKEQARNGGKRWVPDDVGLKPQ